LAERTSSSGSIEEQAAAAPPVYYLAPHWRYFPLLFIVFALAFGGFVVWSAPRPLDAGWIALAGLVAAVFVGGAIFTHLALGRIRLEVGPQGIAYYNVGFKVVTTWDNVIDVGSVWTGRTLVPGLLLRTPAQEAHPLLTIFTAMNAFGKVIPVGYFDREWQHSALGDLIRRYAPQAFPANSAGR
jgi:hypothetical protein